MDSLLRMSRKASLFFTKLNTIESEINAVIAALCDHEYLYYLDNMIGFRKLYKVPFATTGWSVL
jgi:hypothetical protein